MYYNILRVEAPLLVIKILKKISSQSWRFYLKRNETKHKLILHENIHTTREWLISAKELGTMSKNNLRRITLARGPICPPPPRIHSLTLIISWRWWVAMKKKKKKWGVTDFVLERTCLEELLNLSKSGFNSEEDHSGCKFQNIVITALKGNFLCQIWFKGPIKRI